MHLVTEFKRLKSVMVGLVFGLLVSLALPAGAEEAEGDWGGILAGQLHIIVHIKKAPDGTYSGNLESPDQGTFVLPMDTVTADASHLTFAISKVQGRYEGTWNEAKKAWVGTWYQGQAMPLELARLKDGKVAAEVRRPQEETIAASPPPYLEQTVRFDSRAGTTTISLSGTLCMPEGKGPFPAVVLIAGSGPNTRDEVIFGHKVFLVLSDALCRKGIAVLRYDKRGTGSSDGSFKDALVDDFTDDAKVALEFLTLQPGIDKAHVGLIGHSEGGLIAPRIANISPKARFIVMLAGPGFAATRSCLCSKKPFIAPMAPRKRRSISSAAVTRRSLRPLSMPQVRPKRKSARAT